MNSAIQMYGYPKNPTFTNVIITGDLTVEGNFNFGDAGTDILTVAGYIKGSASGKTYVAIGNATTSHSLAATNDLMVGGKLEVDGESYFDSMATFYQSASQYVKMSDTGGSGAQLNIVTSNNGNPALRVQGTGTADLLNVLDNTTEIFTILDGGNVGIRNDNPANTLDIVGPSASNMSIRFADQAGNNTNKIGRILGRSYTGANDITALGYSNINGENRVFIGGGVSAYYASTSILFYTAANAATALGTNIATMNQYGIGIGTTPAASRLEIVRDQAGSTTASIDNPSTSAGATAGWTCINDNDKVGRLAIGGSGNASPTFDAIKSRAFLTTDSNGISMVNSSSGDFQWYAGGYAAANLIMTLSATGLMVNRGLTTSKYSGSLADDGTISLATGVAGQLRVWVDGEYLNVYVDTAGTVTLISGSANTAITDSDGDLCAYDGGTGVVIKNRLGDTKTVRYVYEYS